MSKLFIASELPGLTCKFQNAKCKFGSAQRHERLASENLDRTFAVKCFLVNPNSTRQNLLARSVGKTEELRKVVPKTVKIGDAIHNMGRIAWLINALLTGKTKSSGQGYYRTGRARAREPEGGRERIYHESICQLEEKMDVDIRIQYDDIIMH